MKRIVLFLFALCAVAVSCTRQVKQPLDFNVTNDALQTGVLDVYVPDNGTYDMAVLVKFLSGYNEDLLTVTLSGLPAGVTVTPDTPFTAIPTYTEHFIFTTKNVPLGKYQLTLTASTPGQVPKAYNFNLIVITANCSTIFAGSLSAANECTSNYTYTTTGSVSDTSDVLYINNFGGYGPVVNAQILLDCEKNTLTMPLQTAGNGTVLQGSGTFTQNQMVISYSAVKTPGGPADYCTVTFTK